MSKVVNIVSSILFFIGVPALVAWAFITGYRSDNLTTTLLWILVWLVGSVIWLWTTRPLDRWLLRTKWQRWSAIVGPVCAAPIVIFWYTGGPLQTVIWSCWFSAGFGIGLAWSLVEDYPDFFKKYPISGGDAKHRAVSGDSFPKM